MNLCAEPHAQVQLGRGTARARSASRHELDRYWPQLTQIWPACQDFYEEGGQRSVFVLEPDAQP